MTHELKTGDVVNLITGGSVKCDWFDDNQKLRSGVFKIRELRKFIRIDET